MQNQQIAERIKSICKEKRVSLTSLIATCTLSKSFIYDLEKRNKTPSVSKLAQIADYLDCSVDYLLGRTEEQTAYSNNTIHNSQNVALGENAKITSEINDFEKEMLDAFKTLSFSDKAKVMNLIIELKK